MAMKIEDVVDHYAAALARVAGGYESDRALREDLVQEILLAIMVALPRLRDPTKLSAFVFRIAHNKCVDHVVRRQREPKLGEWIVEPASDMPDPEQAAIGRQEQDALQAAVRSLPLPYRQVILLLLEGLQHQEIAEVLGISVANVAVRINRAKQQIRSKVEP